eukprot:TRINITY_DN2920_c0_g1_i16.p1 TRINITY_DN2920_c0_g1~~TRINITY_DN2920_c0_g1_i16.p1  ORF type:complete len:229 (+),score=80.76 TRINITY_DN2920_c0_g1_i16:69-755(+)
MCIRDRYKHWARKLFKVKTELYVFHSRVKCLNICVLVFVALLASLILAVLYFKQLRRYTKEIKLVLIGIVGGIILMAIYKRYASYKIGKLNKKKLKCEKKKESNVNTVLDELSPGMKKNLRENIIVEHQTTLDNQRVKLQRIEKEIEMYDYELREKRKLIKRLQEFDWCDYCIGRLESKESLLFKCPNECLKEYFRDCEKFAEEFELVEEMLIEDDKELLSAQENMNE